MERLEVRDRRQRVLGVDRVRDAVGIDERRAGLEQRREALVGAAVAARDAQRPLDALERELEVGAALGMARALARAVAASRCR